MPGDSRDNAAGATRELIARLEPGDPVDTDRGYLIARSRLQRALNRAMTLKGLA
jgi:hypothetical protein